MLLGHITGAHGIRGAVLVRSYTAEPEAIAEYGELEDGAGNVLFALSVEGATAKGLICRVPGVDDRTGAERLKGTALFVPRGRLPPPEDGSYYHTDLIGLRAEAQTGAALGEVIAVLNYGAGDILEVRPEGAKRTQLYPMTEAVVLRVDIPGEVVIIAPPDEVDAGEEDTAD